MMLESDPLDLLVGPDGDVVIDADGLHLVSGIEGVAQLCRIAILLFLAEWFLNLEEGTPWYQSILGEKFDADQIRSLLIGRVAGVPGVVEVLSLVPTIDADRRVSVTWSVRTVFGDTEPDTLAVPRRTTSG